MINPKYNNNLILYTCFTSDLYSWSYKILSVPSKNVMELRDSIGFISDMWFRLRWEMYPEEIRIDFQKRQI